ncbi:Uncharacterised protein [Kingella potus]|uniref:DUF4190 domain-containing protein n=1 Tax=Kingella potus TaxID=265175 RepID=A0A377R3D5_9NEIS|nr:DUF4190 domain-containing protein [Kingella potus]UOP00597.1 DUF4190 domain-containing protein [Kingella potus]STR03006.1 Uncharacterised protein [Kingella potus]
MRLNRQSALRRTNILAPVSLVCGILAWTLLPFFAALAAMFCGHVAHAKSKRLNVGGRGMAMAGMVLGYSGLAAAAILFGAWVALPEGKSLFGGSGKDKPAVTEHRPSERPFAIKPAAPKSSVEKPLPAVIPPQAEVILAAQKTVAERLQNGEPLDEINESFVQAEDRNSHWQSIEAKQGSIIVTPKPDKHGFSRQIILLSAQEEGRLTWSCIGELEEAVEQTVCR